MLCCWQLLLFMTKSFPSRMILNRSISSSSPQRSGKELVMLAWTCTINLLTMHWLTLTKMAMGSAMSHISKPSHASLLRNGPSFRRSVTTVDIKATSDLSASIILLIKEVVNFLCLTVNVLNLHSTRMVTTINSAKILNSRHFSPLLLLSQLIIMQRL
jgi:hypothetical protein